MDFELIQPASKSLMTFNHGEQIEILIWTSEENPKFRAVVQNGIEYDLNTVSLGDQKFKITIFCLYEGISNIVLVGHNASIEVLQIKILPKWLKNCVGLNLPVASSKSKISNKSLQLISKKIDRFVEAGINLLYLNPIHFNGVHYRKTNLSDAIPDDLFSGTIFALSGNSKNYLLDLSEYDINQSKDTTDYIKQFIDVAHSRGIRIVFDLILNHTYHDFLLQKVYPEWFYYKEEVMNTNAPFVHFSDGAPWGNSANTMIPFERGSFYWSDTAKLNWNYEHPPASNNPPENHSIRQMYDYFVTVAEYWVKEYNIDGYRCELANKIPSSFWTECINRIRSSVRSSAILDPTRDNSFVFIAETPKENAKDLLDIGFDLCVDPEVSFINLTDYFKEDLESNSLNTSWLNTRDEVNLHSSRRDKVDALTKEQLIMWWAMMVTLPGVPMFGIMSKLFKDHASENDLDIDIFEIEIKKLNTFKHTEKALQGSDFNFLKVNEDIQNNVIAYSRKNNNEKIIVIINHSESQISGKVTLDLESDLSYVLKDLYSNKIYLREGNELSVILDPRNFHIFKVEQNWGDK